MNVDPEALPEGLRRFEWLRRLSVRVAAWMFRSVDLSRRRYPRDYESTLAELAPLFEAVTAEPLGRQLAPLRTHPNLIEALGLAIEERARRSSLDPSVLARIQAGVEAALPRCKDEASGFHPRPHEPVDAFVFVGTRYPARTTSAMIDGLRAVGYDDLGILDLATAVADANQWARTHRLLGLDPGLFYVREAREEAGLGPVSDQLRPASASET